MHQTLQLKPLALYLKQVSALLLLAVLLSACSAGQYISKGDKKFEEEQYERAIGFYKKALDKNSNSGEVNYKIAEAYRLSNRIAQAEPYYQAALAGNNRREDAFFYYGLALKANGQYDKALGQFQDYLRIGSDPVLKARAAKEIENFSTVSDILDKAPRYEITNLEGLNTDASEFGPQIVNNELVFSSTRGDGKKYMGDGQGFIDIYATALADSINTIGGNTRKYEGINLEGFHDALPAFTDEGRTMVFARSNEGTKKGRRNVSLFVSFFRSGAWSEPKLLSISDPQAWDSSPAFSPDGKTLYFSSNRRGGFGGNDIYKSTINSNGSFSNPENLGGNINTAGNESFVGVGTDGALYIASDGLPGLGNLDLFRVEDGKPVNMGQPINSPGDDFGIVFKNKNQGFFSSNRDGGKGGDDIYYFSKSAVKRVNFFVDGILYQLQDGAKQRTVVPNNPVTLQNEEGQNLQTVSTDAEGKFSFPLDTASTYFLVSEKPNFFTARQQISTVGKMPKQEELQEEENEIRLSATLVLNEIVKEKAIVLDNIFYDFDKADIRPDAALELDKLVQVLEDNPTISIELSSHTDARGTDAYNQDLSQRRAESAVEYIISKGIDPSRITAKGYGESKLVVENATTDEEHQQNRRTEFKVVRIQE